MSVDQYQSAVVAFVLTILGLWMVALLAFATWLFLTQPFMVRSC